jgi:hypothetical protein
VFPVIAQTLPGESLSIDFADGDTITGHVDWASLDDGSLNPHAVGTFDYTASGDAAFVDAFGATGSAAIDFIAATTKQTLENWNVDAGWQFSAGEIVPPSAVDEPSTWLAALGGMLIAVYFGRKRRTVDA